MATTGMLVMTLEWHAVHVKPSCEKMATEGVVDLGFEVFCPIVTIVLPPRTSTGTKRRGPLLREELLLPGYLFILLDIERDGWRKINGLPGIIKLLPIHREIPVAINGDLVEDWIERYRLKGKLTYQEALEAATRYLSGDIVKIVDGPFVGHEGKFRCRYYTGGELLLALQVDKNMVKTPAQFVEPVSAR
jgi:transcriptional antiterminator RfaH